MCFQVKKVTVNGHVILTVIPLWGSLFKNIQWMESSRLLVTGILHPLFSKITLCLVYTLFNNGVPCLNVHSLPFLVTTNGRMRLQRDMSSICPLLSPSLRNQKRKKNHLPFLILCSFTAPSSVASSCLLIEFHQESNPKIGSGSRDDSIMHLVRQWKKDLRWNTAPCGRVEHSSLWLVFLRDLVTVTVQFSLQDM